VELKIGHVYFVVKIRARAETFLTKLSVYNNQTLKKMHYCFVFIASSALKRSQTEHFSNLNPNNLSNYIFAGFEIKYY
jgi:hypothetical protein